MELKEFIATGLIQICQGIAEAQRELVASDTEDTIIAPTYASNKARPFISFDITCTIQQGFSGDAKAGVKTNALLEVVGLSARADGNITSENLNEKFQKISFDVPFAPHLICKLKGNINTK